MASTNPDGGASTTGSTSSAAAADGGGDSSSALARQLEAEEEAVGDDAAARLAVARHALSALKTRFGGGGGSGGSGGDTALIVTATRIMSAALTTAPSAPTPSHAAQTELGDSGACEVVTSIAHTHAADEAAVQARVANTMGRLCLMHPHNHVRLFVAQAPQAVVRALAAAVTADATDNEQFHTVEQCLQALSNLCRHAASSAAAGAAGAPALVAAAMAAHRDNADVQLLGCIVIGRLAVQHKRNGAALAAANASAAVCSAMAAAPSLVQLQQAGLDAMTHLCDGEDVRAAAARCGEAGACEAAVAVLRRHGGLPDAAGGDSAGSSGGGGSAEGATVHTLMATLAPVGDGDDDGDGEGDNRGGGGEGAPAVRKPTARVVMGADGACAAVRFLSVGAVAALSFADANAPRLARAGAPALLVQVVADLHGARGGVSAALPPAARAKLRDAALVALCRCSGGGGGEQAAANTGGARTALWTLRALTLARSWGSLALALLWVAGRLGLVGALVWAAALYLATVVAAEWVAQAWVWNLARVNRGSGGAGDSTAKKEQ